MSTRAILFLYSFSNFCDYSSELDGFDNVQIIVEYMHVLLLCSCFKRGVMCTYYNKLSFSVYLLHPFLYVSVWGTRVLTQSNHDSLFYCPVHRGCGYRHFTKVCTISRQSTRPSWCLLHLRTFAPVRTPQGDHDSLF